MAKISVIVPIYNVEKYLAECLESIINQTLTDIEIICINDGSTDNSAAILQEYKLKDSRIIVINKENSGGGESRNIGIKTASGEYIGFVDSDDWIDKDYYEKLYQKAQETGADIVRTCYQYEYTDGKSIPEMELGKIINKRYKKKEFLNPNEHSVIIWNAIYKRKYILEKNIFQSNVRHGDDLLFTAKATLQTDKCVPLEGHGYHYRTGINGQNSELSASKTEVYIRANREVIEFLNSIDLDNNTYLVAFDRCINRLKQIFKDSLKFNWFTDEFQREYFKEYSKLFNLCKYPTEYDRIYGKPYTKHLQSNNFEKFYLSCLRRIPRYRKILLSFLHQYLKKV